LSSFLAALPFGPAFQGVQCCFVEVGSGRHRSIVFFSEGEFCISVALRRALGDVGQLWHSRCVLVCTCTGSYGSPCSCWSPVKLPAISQQLESSCVSPSAARPFGPASPKSVPQSISQSAIDQSAINQSISQPSISSSIRGWRGPLKTPRFILPAAHYLSWEGWRVLGGGCGGCSAWR
jgi:hypothetical protein